MQHIIGILRDSAQIVLLPDDIVPGIVGKGGLVSQRSGDPCQPVGRVIGIAVGTAAGQDFPFHLTVCVHPVLRHAAQGIHDLCYHVMAVIGIVLLGSQGRELFHHPVQGVIFILPGLPHAVCHGEDISHGVVTVPLRDPLRGSDGDQVVPTVIGVPCLSAVSVGICCQAAQSIVAVGCPYSVSVCPRRQVAISVIGKCGGGSLRIYFPGKAVQGVISIGIKRLSGQSLSGQVARRIIGIGSHIARGIGDGDQPVQSVIGVKGFGSVHIGDGDHTSEPVIFVEGAAPQHIRLLYQISRCVIGVGHPVSGGVGGLCHPAHGVIGQRGLYAVSVCIGSHFPCGQVGIAVFFPVGVGVRQQVALRIHLVTVGISQSVHSL